MRYPEHTTSGDYRDMVEDSIARNSEKVRFGVIMDMRLASPLGGSSEARRDAAAVMAEHRDWFREVLVCSIRVTPNPIVRGVLTVYDWLSPASWPRRSVSDGRLAEVWARGKLAAEGIACAPDGVWRD